MARYLLTERAYINDRIHEAGEYVETLIRPGAHMEPAKDDKGNADKDAVKAKKDAESYYKQTGARTAMPGDPTYIGDLIEHNVSGDGATNGRVESSSSPVGVKVDETGQVRGVG